MDSRASLAMIAGAGLALCLPGPATGVSQSADPPYDDDASSEVREHHRHHHHGGIVQFIAMALDTLGADDSKRPRIEKIQGDLRGCMAPAGRAEKSLHLALADGVAAGEVDDAKVAPILAQLEADANAVHDCSAKALNELHATLSPAERSALVDKLQAHWEVWAEVNDAIPGGREPGGRLTELRKELNLSADQTDRISAALHSSLVATSRKFDRKKAEAHVRTFSAAFAADTFDARADAANTAADLTAHGARRMALFYETVTPFLSPEQRAILAEHLREHSRHQPTASAQ